MQKEKISQAVRLLTCFLMLSSVAILRDARFMGYEINPSPIGTEEESIVRHDDGSLVVNTTHLASDIKGYGGTTPLKITFVDGKIDRIEALNNSETPDFFHRVETELFPKWIGKTYKESASVHVDAVTGATLSSDAVNATIRKAMQEVSELPAPEMQQASWLDTILSVKWMATFLVVVLGAIVPLFYKGRRYRTLQLCLNVLVLGGWSCTFVSYSLMVNYLANGANVVKSIIPLLLLVVAFLYPILGKPKHYCMWICPFGSLQELMGRCVSRKIAISPKMMERLRLFHETLWTILMILMWSGVCFSWMDYELFTAFLLDKASIVVIAVALLFMVLSLFIHRPYCRFVCPTGCMLHIACDVKDGKRNNMIHKTKLLNKQ